MNSRDYWAQRMRAQSARQLAADEVLARRVLREYDAAMRSLDRDLAAFYARYAANEGISMAAARRLLSRAELENFRLSLDEFREKAIAGGFDRQLNEIYLRSRISRIQALQGQIDLRVRALYGSQRDLLHDHLAGTYANTYYRTVYELQRGMGVQTSFAHLDTDTVENIMRRPWLGDHFSGRVWKNRDKLLTELQTTLSQAFVRGEPLERTAALLAKRMNVSKGRAMTLVQTESAYFAARATARGYAETGVKAYDFLSALDLKTCALCGALDGMTFPCSQMQTGVNYPPLHPRCRCTTVPHFDETFSMRPARAARDPQTGKTVRVDNMTYMQWREKYVDSPARSATIVSSGKVGDTDGFTTLERVGNIAFHDKVAVQQQIDSFAAQYAAAAVEHALVLSPDGRSYHLVGQSGVVNTTLAGADALHGAIVIHNHPVPAGHARADSFSRADVLFAVTNHAGMQYLVSGDRRDRFAYTGEATADAAYQAYNVAKNDVLARAFAEELEIGEDNEQEEIMRVLGKYLKGFTYYEGF